jgi:hypothetical protein
MRNIAEEWISQVTDGLFRNVIKNYQSTMRKIAEEWISHGTDRLFRNVFKKPPIYDA